MYEIPWSNEFEIQLQSLSSTATRMINLELARKVQAVCDLGITLVVVCFENLGLKLKRYSKK